MNKPYSLRLPLLGICLALMAWPLYAADTDFSDGITVDSVIDAPDANVGTGGCDDGSGNCTLRAAVMEANANSGADTINLPAGVYLLTIDGVDERCDGNVPCTGSGTDLDPYTPVLAADASIGDLDITDTLTINGAGADVTTVEWDTASLTDPAVGDRIFHIQATTVPVDEVAINNMTLRGGSVGVIPNSDCTVNSNPYDIEIIPGDTCSIWQFRRVGGAIAIGPGAAVVLYEEAVHGPGSSGGGGGGGGGGADMGPFPGGKPGGDESEATVAAVNLSGVVLVNNQSGADGGALFNAAPTTITDSVISGNFSGANGGGIYNDEALAIENTTIGALSDTPPAIFPATGLDAGNQAENGGGIFDTGFHTTTIDKSAINGNAAIGGGGIAGRSLITIDVTNSTISGNTASDVGGGITTNGTVNLLNVTVANNSADTDAPGGGAGLNSFGRGTYNLHNSILSANIKNLAAPVIVNCGCSGGSASCASGRMVSLGYNLEDAATCDLTASGDLGSTDPAFDPAGLANNNAGLDGLTETIALQATSPAIDAASNVLCPNNDQRGSLRPVDGDLDGNFVCDIGAYEAFAATADLHINNIVTPDRVDKGDDFTVTIEVHNGELAGSVTGVIISSTEPAGLTYTGAGYVAPGGTGNCSINAGMMACAVGTLAAGEAATVSLAVNAATATGAGQEPFRITTGILPNDSNPGNNVGSAHVKVLGVSDLALTASTESDTITVGDQVTVNYSVSNAGVDDATRVRFAAALPDSVTFVSAVADNGSACSESDGEVLCELGDIASTNPTVNIALVVRPDRSGMTTLSATVEADGTDPDTTNNSVSALVAASALDNGGGYCSYHPNGRFDPVLPALVFGSLLYLGWRRYRHRIPPRVDRNV